MLSASGENQISIISKDKGFSAVSDFFRIKQEEENVVVHTAPNFTQKQKEKKCDSSKVVVAKFATTENRNLRKIIF